MAMTSHFANVKYMISTILEISKIHDFDYFRDQLMNCENIRHVHIIYDLYYLYFAGIFITVGLGSITIVNYNHVYFHIFYYNYLDLKKKFNYNFVKKMKILQYYIYNYLISDTFNYNLVIGQRICLIADDSN